MLYSLKVNLLRLYISDKKQDKNSVKNEKGETNDSLYYLEDKMKILRKVLGMPFNFLLRRFWSEVLLNNCVVWGDKSRVKIAPTAFMTNTLFNVSSGKIIIEDYVTCGFNVCIITGTHDYTKTGLERRKSFPQTGRDVIIKKGVWIASNVTILGPCVIGENSVIGAGCLIRKDIPPNTICFSGDSLVMKKIKQEP